MKKTVLLWMILAAVTSVSAQINTAKQWVMMPEKIYDYIVGEASGERTLRSIMDMASYERKRTEAEYKGTLHEIAYIMKMMKEYGLDDIRLDTQTSVFDRMGNPTKKEGAKEEVWYGISGSLWEVSPTLQKIADYDEITAMLAWGSENSDVEAELVWISRENLRNPKHQVDVKGKIILTDASVSQGHNYAQNNGGLGVVAFDYSSRNPFDPLHMPNAGVGVRRSSPANPNVKTLFGFNITPRQGHLLRDRLLSGEKISVQAKVESSRAQFHLQTPYCSIKGSDPKAGSIIFSAHLFEGYYKLGANDNISGSAVILEVARTLKTLIDRGLIERPKRTLHFVWGDENAATIPWASTNRKITESALCNINLDMVGINLKQNNSYYTLIRTNFSNPHYVNDVAENFFIYMGETNRESILGRTAFTKPVVAPTGTDDNFAYSISEYCAASDHQVFNDWGIQVPGIMMITWPDKYYHTAQDRVDNIDATQLKRATVLAAATAYTIATAGEEGALRIGAEILANANKRLGFYQNKYIDLLSKSTLQSVETAFRNALFAIEGHAKNEKNTLTTIQELSPESKKIAEFIKNGTITIDKIAAHTIEALKLYADGIANKPLKITLSPAELAASKTYPIQTSKPKELRFGVVKRITDSLSEEERMDFIKKVGIGYAAYIAGMTNSGNNSVLDIHKMMLAQYDRSTKIEDIVEFLSKLEKEGLITIVKK